MKIELGQHQRALKPDNLLIFGVLAKKNDFESEEVLKSLNKDFKDNLLKLAKEEGFKGEFGQNLYFSAINKESIQKIGLLGLGESKNISIDQLRKSGAEALKLAEGKKCHKFYYFVPKNLPIPLFDTIQALTEGFLLSSYRFDKYLSKDKPIAYVKEIEILLSESPSKDKKQAINRAQIISNAVFLARDLINEGPMTCNPDKMAKEATVISKETGLLLEILDENKLKKEKMNLLLAVGQASKETSSPKLIRLSYEPKNFKKTIILVGKGVTFDSGGLNIKPAEGMLDMKVDMSGAASVLATMKALANLKPKVKVVGYMPCVENGIGPLAYHQGDLIISKKGLSVEITNTDAEGRLIMADTFTLAIKKDKPQILIDIATLTGACMIALGRNTAGIFSNDYDLCKDLINLGKAQGEAFWQLPLSEDLQENLKSTQADIKNSGDRYGGAITAALFLKAFVEDGISWAHLDIAGPATNTKNTGYQTVGGAGFGIRTLVDYIMGLN